MSGAAKFVGIEIETPMPPFPLPESPDTPSSPSLIGSGEESGMEIKVSEYTVQTPSWSAVKVTKTLAPAIGCRLTPATGSTKIISWDAKSSRHHTPCEFLTQMASAL
jgi:hypothetical protein